MNQPVRIPIAAIDFNGHIFNQSFSKDSVINNDWYQRADSISAEFISL